jgi:hypothetical protein
MESGEGSVVERGDSPEHDADQLVGGRAEEGFELSGSVRGVRGGASEWERRNGGKSGSSHCVFVFRFT